jgi:hypothetical protein
MVKNTKNYINDKRRIKIPIRSILFWRRKIKSYINTHLLNIIINKKYPTIYISKKYPKMSILELYERINNHLNKYFPNIYQKLNSNAKNGLINNKKEPIEKTDVSQPKKETNKKEIALIKKSKKNKYTKDIMLSNQKNYKKIKPHFKQDKLSNKKNDQCYENNFLIEIKCKDNKENNNINELTSNSKKDLSPSKSSTTSSSSILKKNKFNFLTHYGNAERKSKYFNNDDYYINKLKLIENKK